MESNLALYNYIQFKNSRKLDIPINELLLLSKISTRNIYHLSNAENALEIMQALKLTEYARLLENYRWNMGNRFRIYKFPSIVSPELINEVLNKKNSVMFMKKLLSDLSTTLNYNKFWLEYQGVETCQAIIESKMTPENKIKTIKLISNAPGDLWKPSLNPLSSIIPNMDFKYYDLSGPVTSQYSLNGDTFYFLNDYNIPELLLFYVREVHRYKPNDCNLAIKYQNEWFITFHNSDNNWKYVILEEVMELYRKNRKMIKYMVAELYKLDPSMILAPIRPDYNLYVIKELRKLGNNYVLDLLDLEHIKSGVVSMETATTYMREVYNSTKYYYVNFIPRIINRQLIINEMSIPITDKLRKSILYTLEMQCNTGSISIESFRKFRDLLAKNTDDDIILKFGIKKPIPEINVYKISDKRKKAMNRDFIANHHTRITFYKDYLLFDDLFLYQLAEYMYLEQLSNLYFDAELMNAINHTIYVNKLITEKKVSSNVFIADILLTNTIVNYLLKNDIDILIVIIKTTQVKYNKYYLNSGDLFNHPWPYDRLIKILPHVPLYNLGFNILMKFNAFDDIYRIDPEIINSKIIKNNKIQHIVDTMYIPYILLIYPLNNYLPHPDAIIDKHIFNVIEYFALLTKSINMYGLDSYKIQTMPIELNIDESDEDESDGNEIFNNSYLKIYNDDYLLYGDDNLISSYIQFILSIIGSYMLRIRPPFTTSQYRIIDGQRVLIKTPLVLFDYMMRYIQYVHGSKLIKNNMDIIQLLLPHYRKILGVPYNIFLADNNDSKFNLNNYVALNDVDIK